MIRTLTAAALLFALASTAHADDPEPDFEGTPELSGTRVAGEVLVGAIAGGAGGFVGGMAGLGLSSGCSGEFCSLGYMFLGGYAGYTLSVPLGVYAAGSSSEQTGSLAATYVGSMAGGLAGIALGFATESPAIVLAGPLLGALVGFNATRSYRPTARDRYRVVPNAVSNGQQTTFGISGAF